MMNPIANSKRFEDIVFGQSHAEPKDVVYYIMCKHIHTGKISGLDWTHSLDEANLWCEEYKNEDVGTEDEGMYEYYIEEEEDY